MKAKDQDYDKNSDPNIMANILYNMSLDMDYCDAEDTYDAEIEGLSEELESLQEKDSPLFYVLQNIAEKNEDWLDWLKEKTPKQDKHSQLL